MLVVNCNACCLAKVNYNISNVPTITTYVLFGKYYVKLKSKYLLLWLMPLV